MNRIGCGAAALMAAAGIAAGIDGRIAIGTPDDPTLEFVHGCWEGPDGTLTGVRVLMPIDQAVLDAKVRPARGVADNRVDFVFVGDGYTAAEENTFYGHVDFAVSQLFVYEPFKAYENYFRIHEVFVESNESGVDNDPQGTFRDTAMDMTYWCNGIERLLCINVSKAYSFATLAPDVDQVIALANSTKYGGAGYSGSDLGTAAGGNASAPQIAIHELGHSLGDLADEYTYGGPTTWTGGEPGTKNVSIYEAAQMAADERKWHQWLGYVDTRFDGTVGTYEGGNYSVFGIYRPSNNSMMRSLNRKFNAPSAERLIRSFYLEVSPIDAHSPNGAAVAADAGVSVTPMQPIGHDLDVFWDVDGSPIPAADGMTSVVPQSLGITAGGTLTATVVDNTDMVRDESVRANLMTAQVSWTVLPAACPADMDGDGTLNIDDIDAFVAFFLGGDLAADLDGNGTLNVDDIDAFVAAYLAGC
ncbi:MAG: M64 family metallopeptidase [Phycisphaerales bacterium]